MIEKYEKRKKKKWKKKHERKRNRKMNEYIAVKFKQHFQQSITAKNDFIHLALWIMVNEKKFAKSKQ